MNATRKVKLKDLNPNLTCHLCLGYFVDATTIIECLHSCESLILIESLICNVKLLLIIGLYCTGVYNLPLKLV